MTVKLQPRREGGLDNAPVRGEDYVFVVTYDERATKTDIIVKGLDADGEVTVVDEDRQLTVGDRGLADRLDAAQHAHVYCVN